MSSHMKLCLRIFRTLMIVILLLFYATIFLQTISLVPSTQATLAVFSLPSTYINETINSEGSTRLSTNVKGNKTALRRPTDTYLITSQRECFKSRSFFSCVKYRASKFVWSLATNQYNYFDASNSNSYIDVNPNQNSETTNDVTNDDDSEDDYDDDLVDNNKVISDRRNFNNSTVIDKKPFQMKFVFLNSPSDLELFEETRTFQGDGEISKALKFVKRAVQTFVQNHGLQVSLNSLGGFQVSRGGKNYITGPLERQYYSDYLYRRHKHLLYKLLSIKGRGHHKNLKKRLKFAILLPIIILLKLFHLKLTLLPLLFLMNGLNLFLIAGGTYILYYLKHHTICKIKPHLLETHSHVYDSVPPESRGHKKTRKKLKWLILFPLIILGKIASLKMSTVVLMFTVIGAQLALAGGFAFIIYWLKHNYLCKINPKWAETVSGLPTWEHDGGGHFRRSFKGRTKFIPIDYSSFAYAHGPESSPYGLTSKDWANSKAYNAYNYLDTISRPI